MCSAWSSTYEGCIDISVPFLMLLQRDLGVDLLRDFVDRLLYRLCFSSGDMG